MHKKFIKQIALKGVLYSEIVNIQRTIQKTKVMKEPYFGD